MLSILLELVHTFSISTVQFRQLGIIGMHFQVIMAAGEVENAAYQFMMSLGRAADWDPEEFDSVASVIPAFKLGIFITVRH